MTKEQIQLVKSTAPILRQQGVLLTSHFYKRMFAYNPELKHVFNMGNQQNSKQQTALALAVLAYAEHIENPAALMPTVDHIGQKHTSLDIRPEHYAIVGKHLIASISEVLGESASPALLEAWTLAYQQLASIMSGHEQKIYDTQSSKQGGWTGWRPFIVKQKVRESSEITSFYLYPSDKGQVADHLPGQYISLRLFLPELNLLQPRQYSVSSSPNGAYYRISVKREVGSQHPDGMISNRLHDHVQEGDAVDLSAPAGSFVLNKESHAHKVFISGGVGQTPLLSMLEDIVSRPQIDHAPVTWIHGCRSEQIHAFKDRLTEISSVYQQINQHIFYEDITAPVGNRYPGRVELDVLKNEILGSKADYYICGPAPFIRKHYDYLIANGVSHDAIHFEEFGPASLQLN
ncbi:MULTISPECIES: NO-inducible flavohemoprotein [Sphingobacterium]|uniref:NO-inducible flavohemoprotein n=1 Tax=Sphingobacterium TaxID=28453 RepID=UPI0013DBE76B|nr:MULTISPECIES: NO-inducible flavohemoprotein [unclassified Sphingobacterium]